MIIDHSGFFTCPICGIERQFNSGIGHHVHWYYEGGHNKRWNVLRICSTCHAILTSGDNEERVVYEAACTRFMTWKYGILFLLQIESFHVGMMKTLRTCKDVFDDAPKNFIELLAMCRKVDDALRYDYQEKYISIVQSIRGGRNSILEEFEKIANA